jgi:hypothetical protein
MFLWQNYTPPPFFSFLQVTLCLYFKGPAPFASASENEDKNTAILRRTQRPWHSQVFREASMKLTAQLH